MAEESPRRGRVRDAAGRVAGAPGRATRALTGKDVEQRITEYSELYTQVLFGIHGEMEAQNRKLDAYGAEMEALKRQFTAVVKTQDIEDLRARLKDHDTRMAELNSQLATMPKAADMQVHDVQIEALSRQVASIRTARTLAIAAIIMGLLALGGALWAIL